MTSPPNRTVLSAGSGVSRSAPLSAMLISTVGAQKIKLIRFSAMNAVSCRGKRKSASGMMTSSAPPAAAAKMWKIELSKWKPDCCPNTVARSTPKVSAAQRA